MEVKGEAGFIQSFWGTHIVPRLTCTNEGEQYDPLVRPRPDMFAIFGQEGLCKRHFIGELLNDIGITEYEVVSFQLAHEQLAVQKMDALASQKKELIVVVENADLLLPLILTDKSVAQRALTWKRSMGKHVSIWLFDRPLPKEPNIYIKAFAEQFDLETMMFAPTPQEREMGFRQFLETYINKFGKRENVSLELSDDDYMHLSTIYSEHCTLVDVARFLQTAVGYGPVPSRITLPYLQSRMHMASGQQRIVPILSKDVEEQLANGVGMSVPDYTPKKRQKTEDNEPPLPFTEKEEEVE